MANKARGAAKGFIRPRKTASEFNKSVQYECNWCLNWFVAGIKLVLVFSSAGELAGYSAVATWC